MTAEIRLASEVRDELAMELIRRRARAELVREGLLELAHVRGRMAKVTVDDVARLLAAVDDVVGHPGDDLRPFLQGLPESLEEAVHA